MKHPFIILVTCIWLSTQVPVAIAQQAQLVEAAFSPSLLPDKQSDSPPLLGITGRVRITDNDRFLSEVLDLAEQARGLGDRSESGVLLLDFETDSLIAEMKELDGQFATGRANFAVLFDAPLLPEGWHLCACGQGRFAGTFVYDPEDEQRLQLATMTAGLTPSDLESTIETAGVAVIDLALMKRFNVNWLKGFNFGASFKYQYIILQERKLRLVEHEDDELFDPSRDSNEHHFGNIDIGLTKKWASWDITAVLRNLIPGEFDGPLTDSGWQSRPHLELHAQRPLSIGSLSISGDITERTGFSHVPKERRTGIKLVSPIHPKINSILGYKNYDNSIDKNSVLMGLDYFLLEYFHLAATMEFSDSREFGAMVEVQLLF